MYNILIREKRVQNKAILKWEENDTIFNENDWYKIFELPFKTTKESKFHWLQFQILHKILPTFLYCCVYLVTPGVRPVRAPARSVVTRLVIVLLNCTVSTDFAHVLQRIQCVVLLYKIAQMWPTGIARRTDDIALTTFVDVLEFTN